MADIDKLVRSTSAGRTILSTGKTDAEPLLYDSKDLTTHAVCVGMTGSGKTGLCLSLLEEAALDGIPAIAIDPKGDLGNLLLAFPNLAPSDFRPWIDESEAARKQNVARRVRRQPGRALAQRPGQMGRRAGPHPPLLRRGRPRDLHARLQRRHPDHGA